MSSAPREYSRRPPRRGDQLHPDAVPFPLGPPVRRLRARRSPRASSGCASIGGRNTGASAGSGLGHGPPARRTAADTAAPGRARPPRRRRRRPPPISASAIFASRAGDTDPQPAGDQLEQREPHRRHRRSRASRRPCPAVRPSARSPASPPPRPARGGAALVGGGGPHQRHRFRQVADIVVGPGEQLRIGAGGRQLPDQAGLGGGEGQLAGDRGQPDAAVGSGCVAKYRRSSAILALREGVKTRRSSSSAKAIMGRDATVPPRCGRCSAHVGQGRWNALPKFLQRGGDRTRTTVNTEIVCGTQVLRLQMVSVPFVLHANSHRYPLCHDRRGLRHRSVRTRSSGQSPG